MNESGQRYCDCNRCAAFYRIRSEFLCFYYILYFTRGLADSHKVKEFCSLPARLQCRQDLSAHALHELCGVLVDWIEVDTVNAPQIPEILYLPDHVVR